MEQENLYEWIKDQIKNDKFEDCYNYLNNTPRLASQLWDDTLEYLYNNIKPHEINTIQDLAKLLNHNWHTNELANPYDIDVEKICQENKWIILFPYSDDNLEIRGYIDDELGAWDGGKFKIAKKGEFYQDPDDDEIYRKAKSTSIVSTDEDPHIFMMWCDGDYKPYTWYIDTDYDEVAYFEILDEDSEDDEIWAKCCIIDCSKILD